MSFSIRSELAYVLLVLGEDLDPGKSVHDRTKWRRRQVVPQQKASVYIGFENSSKIVDAALFNQTQLPDCNDALRRSVRADTHAPSFAEPEPIATASRDDCDYCYYDRKP